MQDITRICKNFGKRPSHFLDNVQYKNIEVESQAGPKGYTKIPDEYMHEFLLWLSPTTRTMLRTSGLEETLTFAKTYKNP